MQKTLDLNKVKEIIFEDIEKLLDSFDLEYEQVADNIFMKCPIHEGSDNPQGLSISLTKKAWRCWTRGCHEHYNTDIFGFVKGLLQTDSFSKALKYVCSLYNVNGAKADFKQSTKREEDPFSSLVKALKKKPVETGLQPNISPVKTLGKSPYFESRGFAPQTLLHFGVEDCADKKSAMRYRAIIPIRFGGLEIGYIARSTKVWLEPKYLFSSGIRKTDYLYNYDEATKSTLSNQCLFLVEGQGDVWKLWECGVKNAVGLFGKDISERQKTLLLKSGVTTLIILTDNDQVGRESKIKIKRSLGKLFKLVFPRMESKDLGSMSKEKMQTYLKNNLKGYYYDSGNFGS